MKPSIKKNAEKIAEIQDVLVSHSKHLEIANSEMGIIKNDINWIKGILEKLDTRIWIILATIILGTVIQIALRLLI